MPEAGVPVPVPQPLMGALGRPWAARPLLQSAERPPEPTAPVPEGGGGRGAVAPL